MLAFFISLLAAPVPSTPDVSLADLTRFPPHAVTHSYREFADAHCMWVREQQSRWAKEAPGSPMEAHYAGWFAEADASREAWTYLDDATDETLSAEARLRALRKLREHLGRGDYFAGRMPQVVPLWYYRWRE